MTERPENVRIGKLGDETEYAANVAISLCRAIEMLISLWTVAIDNANSREVRPGSVFDVCDDFEIGQLRKSVDEFCRAFMTLDLLLFQDGQREHFGLLYSAPIVFENTPYVSYAAAVRSISYQFFEDSMMSLVRDMEGGACIRQFGLKSLPASVELFADQMACQWQRTNQVLTKNRADTVLLSVWLEKERILVEKLVSNSLHKPEPNTAKPVVNGRPATNRNKKKLEWLAKAMLLIQNDPRLSNKEIAKQVGIHESQLSRNEAYNIAAELARAAAQSNAIRKGRITRNMDANTTDVEGVDFDEDDRPFDS